MLTAQWAVRRFCCYTLHLPGLKVVLPHTVAVTMAGVGEQLPPWLQACLVEFSACRCIYVVGDGAWAVGGAVAHLKGSVDMAKVSQNLWEHEERMLLRLRQQLHCRRQHCRGDGACSLTGAAGT